MADILFCDKISLYYDRIRALHQVSLRVGEGETTALIGANGAGKSSVLRAITGLRRLTSGSIHYGNKRSDGWTPAEIVKAGIVMVPEGRRVFPYMSVKDNLLMGAFTRGDRQGIDSDMEKVLNKFPRLKERFHQSASTMSGGEQQMMVIGRAP